MWPSPQEKLFYGDVEAAMIDLLMSTSEVTDLVPFDNITTDLRGFEEDGRWVVLSREGGPSRFPVDFPRVDFNMFAERRSVAQQIGRNVRAIVMASSGYRGHGLYIAATQEEVGLVKGTDKRTATERYFFSVRFTTRVNTHEDES